MIKNAVRLILINVAVLFVLGAIAVTVPATITNVRLSMLRLVGTISTTDPRASLPNYDEYPWADVHFEELKAGRRLYRNYTGWRRDDFEGETIRVVDGRRQTPTPASAKTAATKVHFFGGSTIWGTGVPDNLTIPAQFAALTDRLSVNHGESGYTARQSLAVLTNLVVSGEISPGDTIVFYDGVNDVASRCRREISGLATARDPEVARILEAARQHPPLSYGYLVQPWRELTRKFWQPKKHELEAYRCDRSPERATEIAATLAEVWKTAQQLSDANGASFLAALQPVAFIGKAQTDHLPDLGDQTALARQYEAVYPLIRDVVARDPSLHYVDLTEALPVEQVAYIDFCHLDPRGNAAIAHEIAEALSDVLPVTTNQ